MCKSGIGLCEVTLGAKHMRRNGFLQEGPFVLVLGTHACTCRYGYPSVEYITDVVEKYKQAQIPLETFVTDLDYAAAGEDFTYSAAYPLPKLSAFVQRLHSAGQRWVSTCGHDAPSHMSGACVWGVLRLPNAPTAGDARFLVVS